MIYTNIVVKGLLWSSFEKLSVQLIQFVIGIFLARLLTPSEYGTIGILFVLISFLQVFVDSGFSKALIQEQKNSEIDYSTVFFIIFFISIISYVLLWLSSSLIAHFYNNSDLIIYLRVIGFLLFFNALFTIPNTILIINLDFKVLAKINFSSNLISGVIAVFMAYYGYGIWALIWQQIIRALLLILFSWFIVRWKPTFVFSKESFKRLFEFGSKLLYSSLLGVFVNNFINLFIAKLSSTKDLGYFTRGTQFTDVVYGSANSVLESVLLPVFSKFQNDLPLLVSYFRTILRSVALIIIPIFFLLAFASKPLVLLLLTEKWLPVVPIMQIFCFARLITIIAGLNITVLYSIGRSDLVLKQQVVKIFIRVIFLLFALKFGIIYIAIAELLSTIVHFFINTYYPAKIMKINALLQIKDIMPIVLAGVVMILAVLGATHYVPKNLWFIQLFITGIVGLISYVAMIRILNIKEYHFLCSKLIELRKRN